MPRHDNKPVTTQEEKRFIDRLGTGQFVPQGRNSMTRLEKLRRYRIALMRKTDWDKVDKPEIIHYITCKIAELAELK